MLCIYYADIDGHYSLLDHLVKPSVVVDNQDMPFYAAIDKPQSKQVFMLVYPGSWMGFLI